MVGNRRETEEVLVAARCAPSQTVAQHLRRAGWHALEPAVDFLEGLLA